MSVAGVKCSVLAQRPNEAKELGTCVYVASVNERMQLQSSPAGGPYCTYTPTSQRMRVYADPDVPAQKPGREFTGYKLSLFFP